MHLKISFNRDVWVAQSVGHLTLDFGSGHDLMIQEFEPRVEIYADSMKSVGILSLSLCLKINKYKNIVTLNRLKLPTLLIKVLSVARNKNLLKLTGITFAKGNQSFLYHLRT